MCKILGYDEKFTGPFILAKKPKAPLKNIMLVIIGCHDLIKIEFDGKA